MSRFEQALREIVLKAGKAGPTSPPVPDLRDGTSEDSRPGEKAPPEGAEHKNIWRDDRKSSFAQDNHFLFK